MSSRKRESESESFGANTQIVSTKNMVQFFTEQRECIESGRVGSPSPLHKTLSPPRPTTSPKESHGR
eukprot:COSAG06_NODE_61608_length_267_cov_0.619048_1_plen_66_part_01